MNRANSTAHSPTIDFGATTSEESASLRSTRMSKAAIDGERLAGALLVEDARSPAARDGHDRDVASLMVVEERRQPLSPSIAGSPPQAPFESRRVLVEDGGSRPARTLPPVLDSLGGVSRPAPTRAADQLSRRSAVSQSTVQAPADRDAAASRRL